MKQIPTSKSTQPVWIGKRTKRAEEGEERRAFDRKVETKTIITWPAVIFAANRKAKVIGRTENLIVSTKTKNGFSHAGAPLGRREATNLIGREEMEERIRLNQRVRPNDSVNIR